MSKDKLFVVILYRNFKAFCPGMSHVGLGVNAMMMAKSFKGEGIKAMVVGVNTAQDIDQSMAKFPQATHAIVQAAFISPTDCGNLADKYHNVEWIYRNHSQLGFLQVEPGAITAFRGYGSAQEKLLNVTLSSNSTRYAAWWEATYNQRCIYLPNLYPVIDRTRTKIRNPGTRDTLRFGVFGSMRLLKNFTTAAGAAMECARNMGKDCAIYVNGGRSENGGQVIINAIKAMVDGLPWVTLNIVNWQDWTEFRHTIGMMDVCLQPSFTETFNIVTADAVAEGVPSVVSEAIEWIPPHWYASADDPGNVAQVAKQLILDPQAAADGSKALATYQTNALRSWLTYFELGHL